MSNPSNNQQTGKYYAVADGRNPGIYKNWNDCKDQVHGYSGGAYKRFDNVGDAARFITNHYDNPSSGSSGRSSGHGHGGSRGYGRSG